MIKPMSYLDFFGRSFVFSKNFIKSFSLIICEDKARFFGLRSI